MKYVEVITDADNADTVSAIADKHEVPDFHLGNIGENGLQPMRLLVPDSKIQPVLDSLQDVFDVQSSAQIVVLPVEIALPKPSEEEREEEEKTTEAREALYENVEKNTRLDINYVVLVLLSTAVAAIGLIENNVAVVIGAMVIAPLLGPNLAFGLGTALGDIALMKKSALTTSLGILLAVILSVVIGVLFPFDISSAELAIRTRVGLDSVALALASGAAAALSLTTGLSTILVGVMVAVALLPPAVTLGLMAGQGYPDLAFSAGLLLAINIVCVNLASKVVFFIKGIYPRNWWEKEKARRAMVIYVMVWIVTLVLLVIIIFIRQKLTI